MGELLTKNVRAVIDWGHLRTPCRYRGRDIRKGKTAYSMKADMSGAAQPLTGSLNNGRGTGKGRGGVPIYQIAFAIVACNCERMTEARVCV